MAKRNESMHLRGFDSNSNLTDIEAEQPYSDCTSNKHFGMPITQIAAILMKYAFRQRVINPAEPGSPFADLAWVEFSKASIFRVLAQENCEFIRFYFAIPDFNNDAAKASLVLEGIRSDGMPIKRDVIEEVARLLDPHINDRPIDKDFGLDEDAILAEFNAMHIKEKVLLPQTEEKGNGGKGLLESDQIKFMSDFLAQKEEFANMTISEFISAFYDYAAGRM